MKKILYIILILVITTTIIIFIHNDDFLYHQEILKITSMKTLSEDISMNTLGIKEKYYEKEITGIITNTKNKGQEKTITYEETYSSIVTEKYQVGDKVFLDHSSISGLKRDTYIAILLLSFIMLLLVIGKMKGFLSLISLIFNSFIFYIGLVLYFKGINLLLLCVMEAVIFSIVSLRIAGGRNNKTKAAILSTLVTFTILLIGLSILTKVTNYSGINMNGLSFLTVPVEHIILPELLIGVLGVSMDVAISISSALQELIDKNKKISEKALQKSAKEMGKDIMSTMTNVLFFTYLSTGLPMFVLALRNGFTFYNFVTANYQLEITRFLVGSIALVMTIPISSLISIKVMKKGVLHE